MMAKKGGEFAFFGVEGRSGADFNKDALSILLHCWVLEVGEEVRLMLRAKLESLVCF